MSAFLTPALEDIWEAGLPKSHLNSNDVLPNVGCSWESSLFSPLS